ncbi:MAG: LysR family transcriptional regulator [Xanthobacteraceae bacterium]|nr:LysR family transcriptional regulator [Xanthobacteraceae bacterium]
MELSDLNIFRAVVESGGITRAAEKLHRVPSNVTTRIGQLEDDLGVKLFVREGRNIRLSPAGAILLEKANRLLDLARETREAVNESTPRGILRLGAYESTASVWLPGRLSEFQRNFPQVTLELHTWSLQSMIAGILSGELEAALISGYDDDPRFEKLPLYDDEVVLVAPKSKDPLARGNKNDFVLLSFDDDCPLRHQIERYVREEIRPPSRVIEMSSNHALLGCVAAGMGIGMMPESVLPGFPGHRHLNVHRMPKDVARKRIILTWRKGMRSARIDALVETLTSPKKRAKK